MSWRRFLQNFVLGGRSWLAAMLVLLLATQVSADILSIDSPSLRNVVAGRPPKSLEELRAMDEHLRKLAEFIRPTVVHLRLGASHGSGVVVSRNGLILTAAHVVGGGPREVLVRFADGRRVNGTTLGIDLENDVCLIRIPEATERYLPVSTARKFSTGLWCAASGYPGGFDLERGPVFRVGRILDSGELLRSDCQLIGGDSGGPLVDMQGRVIGIHSRIGASLVNNLHISSTVVRDRWTELTSGIVRRGESYIGVSGNTQLPRCELTGVKPGSPAEHAGLQVGDIVTHFSGQRVWNFMELIMLVQMRRPGERLPVIIRRGEEELELELEIGRLPKSKEPR